MKEIVINSKKYGKHVVFVSDRDYKLVSKHVWHVFKQPLGYTFYASTAINTPVGWRQMYMHRLIMRLKKGEEIDHRNMNGLDNRRSNLRKCKRSENGAHRNRQKNNTTGFKGVVFRKSDKKYQATIKINNKCIHLGLHKTALKAARVYNIAAKELHGKFAILNSI